MLFPKKSWNTCTMTPALTWDLPVDSRCFLESYPVTLLYNELNYCGRNDIRIFQKQRTQWEAIKSSGVLLTWYHPIRGWVRSKSRGTLRQTCRRPTGSLDTAGPAGGSTAAPGVTPPRCSYWRWSPTMNWKVNKPAHTHSEIKLAVIQKQTVHVYHSHSHIHRHMCC